MIESDGSFQREIGDLQEVFEESSLPFKVDLVERSKFVKSYEENYLKERILLLKL